MQREKTLARVTRIRQMQEELSRLELEAAVVARERIFRGWQAAGAARTAGRRGFARSVELEDLVDRQDSLLTIEQSRLQQESLDPLLDSADQLVEFRRAEFLARRTAMRQAETLMEEARAMRNAQAVHRLQQILDDWFVGRNRADREVSKAELRNTKAQLDDPRKDMYGSDFGRHPVRDRSSDR